MLRSEFNQGDRRSVPENDKTLKDKVKKTQISGEIFYLSSWIGRIDVTRSILPKVNYRYYTLPPKVPMAFSS